MPASTASAALTARATPDPDGAVTFLIFDPWQLQPCRFGTITPKHFSRVLHEPAEARLIEVTDRSVSILDMERLSSFESCIKS